ncbi:MAG: hypothetical protein ABSD98_02695 [Candidatus Korobacteraceae bacterium]|jgi:hypothetical protein
MNQAAQKATSGPNPEPDAHPDSPPVQPAHSPVAVLTPPPVREHGPDVPHTNPHVHEHVVREKLEELLSGPPIVRLIAGSLFLMVALAGAFVGLREQWEKFKAPHPDYTALNVPKLTGAFDKQVLACKHGEACIAGALSELPHEVRSKDEHATQEGLFADQVIGEIVRSSPEAMQLLHKVYGVDQGFLGTGLSEPAAQSNFAKARFPEYLVPNYRESHEGVLVWNLTKLQYLQANLYETLRTMPPVNAKGWAPQELNAMRELIEQRTVWKSDLPAMVRFALIPKGQYSHCLGRKEAHKVFVNDLGPTRANNLTLEESARMSGYPVTDAPERDRYVFVFLPQDKAEFVPPTWGSMVSNIGAEVAKPSPCMAAASAER